MAKMFRYREPPGKPFKHRREKGCDWCRYGDRPSNILGICESCVHTYKLALCSVRWRNARLAFLSLPGNQICHPCRDRDIITPAEEVHHLHPWRFFPDLFWEMEFWQPICSTCHKVETVEHHGAFGRPITLLPAPPPEKE